MTRETQYLWNPDDTASYHTTLDEFRNNRPLLESCLRAAELEVNQDSTRKLILGIWTNEAWAITSLQRRYTDVTNRGRVLVEEEDASDGEMNRLDTQFNILTVLLEQAKKRAPEQLQMEWFFHEFDSVRASTPTTRELEETANYIPPGDLTMESSGDGENTEMSKEKVLLKNQFLIELLDEKGANYHFKPGGVEKHWARELGYNAYSINMPDGRTHLMFVSDSYGEMSFVIHDTDKRKWGDEIKRFGNLQKTELYDHPQVSHVQWTGDQTSWKEKVWETLNKENLTAKHVEIKAEVNYLTLSNVCGLYKKIYKKTIGQSFILRVLNHLIENSDNPFKDTPHKKEFRRSRGKIKEMDVYSEELTKRCVRLAHSLYPPDNSWKNPAQIEKMAKTQMKELGLPTKLDYGTVQELIAFFMQKADAEEKQYKSGLHVSQGGKRISSKENPFGLVPFYSKELVEDVINKIVRETAPKDWVSSYNIEKQIRGKKEYSKDVKYIAEAFQKLKDSNPEYKYGYFRGTGPAEQSRMHLTGPDKNLKLYVNPALNKAILDNLRARPDKRRVKR